ncbi:hypothetical protein BJ508DRAFT_46201 [Ascobolus immersus RN42]|uniref:Uncharacterized protein n=1 Tax=Ascobolus immersus RN42 TaxID=1160509 RepID=A0A3N4IIH3_ASCIM|nr:hypothetical protein BJ508DRAFT_46201 [Ascobolus immersus RN42]
MSTEEELVEMHGNRDGIVSIFCSHDFRKDNRPRTLLPLLELINALVFVIDRRTLYVWHIPDRHVEEWERQARRCRKWMCSLPKSCTLDELYNLPFNLSADIGAPKDVDKPMIGFELLLAGMIGLADTLLKVCERLEEKRRKQGRRLWKLILSSTPRVEDDAIPQELGRIRKFLAAYTHDMATQLVHARRLKSKWELAVLWSSLQDPLESDQKRRTIRKLRDLFGPKHKGISLACCMGRLRTSRTYMDFCMDMCYRKTEDERFRIADCGCTRQLRRGCNCQC